MVINVLVENSFNGDEKNVNVQIPLTLGLGHKIPQKEINEVDWSVDLNLKTSASCFKSIGFASCLEEVMKETPDRIAAKLCNSVTFYMGKSVQTYCARHRIQKFLQLN